MTTSIVATIDRTKLVSLIGDIVFMPTWRFVADEIWRDTAYVYAYFTAPNSDRQYAAAGYPTTVQPAALMEINVADCRDDDDFYRRFMEEWGRTMMHEGCEFLRLRSRDFDAPFHPHRPECRANWVRSGGDPTAVRR